ncbi:unnamed protein product [Cuscuta campestris]|uniref:RNase H type-1 domain-containing protein n=1 Tax=Cuscuta campestris TaxID=132261 RepID=A0A484LSV7_9ASTE|nr:unnamed protein product [Cuscuta campestris]
MMANIMERLDQALPSPSGTRNVPTGQLRQVLYTASSPILQELHDPEEVERERQAIARRQAEEMARNNRANGDRTRAVSQAIGNGNENPRGAVFERISHQRAHVSERLGKNPDKAPQGWVRPQASQVASSNREPRQRAERGGSQAPMRSLVVLDDKEVQSQARIPAPQRLGPQVPEAGEFQDLRQQIQEMQRKINRGRVFTARTNTLLAPEIFAEPYPQGDALMCRCFLQKVDSKVADWVNHIPAGSIRTWDELGLRFLEYFAGNCRPKKHFTHLASVRQKHEESLKYFLVRWRKESREVGEVTAQLLRPEERCPIVEVAGDIEEVELEPGTPGRLVRIGKDLGAELMTRVISVLRKFRKVFAWSPADMPGLDHKIAVHRLNVLRDAKPVKEKRRHLSQERRDFVKKEGGKFLGHMVSWRGIEANPEKVRVIMEVEPPKTAKEVQWLRGRLAALIRFLSKLAEKAHPFFTVIKKRATFEWTQECQVAFEELKRYLASPPVLSKPEPGDVLTLYLEIVDCAISTVIVREENGAQHPVYYVSMTLRDAELRYSRLEKAMLVVFWTVKRSTPYFQAHRIVVLTNEPLASLTRSPAASARMTKRAVFISQYNVEFRSRPSIKGQALADVHLECTAREMTRARVETRVEDDWWMMSIDGSSGSRSCGAGIILITPENFRIYYAIRFQFRVSNNEAEYEALINGLKIPGKLGVSRVQVYSDSRLVVGQINGEFEAKEERMKRYRDLSLEMLGRFEYKLEHIPRAHNAEADVLSKLSAESPEYISKLATVEELATTSLNRDEVLWVSADPPEWLDRLARYIEDGVAPEDPQEARLLRMRAPTYKVQDGVLSDGGLSAAAIKKDLDITVVYGRYLKEMKL